VGLLSKPTFSA